MSAEARRSKRSHAMLSASLRVDGAEWPVRLRNISQVGALVEVPKPAEVGAPVVLSRLDVEIGATVARRDGKCLGLRFLDPIDSDTLESLKLGKAALKRAGRASIAAPPARAGASTGVLRPALDPLDLRIAKELEFAQSLLGQISDPLTQDPVLLERHGRPLQNFDFVTQLLGHLAKVLSTEDRGEAIDNIGMVELRARLRGEDG